MKLHLLPLGALEANCYLLETDAKNAIAFDIGGDHAPLEALLRRNQLTLKKILLTHGHFDHIAGVAQLRLHTGAAVYIHEADLPLLQDDRRNLAALFGDAAVAPVTDAIPQHEGDCISLDELSLTVLHTPGHTAGSVCFRGDGLLFSGDTLFHGGAGRTDFPGSSRVQMQESLRRLGQLAGNDRVYPGHGGGSTLDEERRYNPYLGAAL